MKDNPYLFALMVVLLLPSIYMLKEGSDPFEAGCAREYFCISACPFDAMTIDDRGFPEINTTRCVAWNNETERFVWERCGLCLQGCPTRVLELLDKLEGAHLYN
jgi:Na+-translocating ferredoxin:NAD+ oxidoreductase RNF subunit RnfB